MDDTHYMKIALRLARKGWGKTSPNPLVGAILVKEGRIIGRGYHRLAGTPHAEIHALEEAGEEARGSVLYVNLEPCVHFGRTPPCVPEIIRGGVKEVVVAMEDPNPLVKGRGIKQLQEAGVRVRWGVLEEEAKILNEAYGKYITTKFPFVRVKWAMSLDGKIATREGESRWISGERSRLFAHWLRQGSDAILVGVNTVIQDDPSLTVRGLKVDKQPLRVVVDAKGRTPESSRLLNYQPARTLIAVTEEASEEAKRRFQNKGVEVLKVKGERGKVNLKSLLQILGKRGIVSLLIEGGGEVIASALEEEVVDKVHLFISPRIIGGRNSPTPVEGEGVEKLEEAWRIKGLRYRRLGEDLLVEGHVDYG